MSEMAEAARRALDRIAGLSVDKRPVFELTAEEARARTRAVWAGYLNAEPPWIEQVSDHEIATSEGPIRVRLYDSGSDHTHPILYFHGGGFLVGDLDTHDGVARRLALYSGLPVVSVDYRLAPEHPYPIPLADCTAATVAIAGNTAGLDLDGTNFALAGDSAGANLALGTVLRLRGSDFRADAALLIFGNYDPAQAGTSHARYAKGYGLTSGDVAYYWRQYLGERIHLPPHDAAALQADLRGLPPLFVAAAECDPIRDDSVALVEVLKAVEAPHTFRLWKGMIHGCVGMARNLNQADAQLAEAATWLATKLRG